MSNTVHIPLCAGVVTFNEDNSKCILVRTGDNNGFPKGKLKGKKDKRESYKAGSLRELEEETGITEPQIKFVSDETIDEINENGNAVIRYFVAKYIGKPDHVFTFDPTELDFSGWVNINDAKNILIGRRLIVLEKAIKILNSQ